MTNAKAPSAKQGGERMTPWRTGAPPCVGWWNASSHRDHAIRRHWNGFRWSGPARIGDSDANTNGARKHAGFIAYPIEWRGLIKPRQDSGARG